MDNFYIVKINEQYHIFPKLNLAYQFLLNKTILLINNNKLYNYKQNKIIVFVNNLHIDNLTLTNRGLIFNDINIDHTPILNEKNNILASKLIDLFCSVIQKRDEYDNNNKTKRSIINDNKEKKEKNEKNKKIEINEIKDEETNNDTESNSKKKKVFDQKLSNYESIITDEINNNKSENKIVKEEKEDIFKIFSVDKKVYSRIANDINKKTITTIPDLFRYKYPIFEILNKHDSINFDNDDNIQSEYIKYEKIYTQAYSKKPSVYIDDELLKYHIIDDEVSEINTNTSDDSELIIHNNKNNILNVS